MEKMNRWAHRILFALPALLILFLYGSTLHTIGFLSDDWDLLERVRGAPFYMPIENHHYNLFINFLFKQVTLGNLSPAGIHLIAIAGHFINTYLVFLIARKGFSQNFTVASGTSLLFAVSPAGVEAIVWCCAIGYIATTFWILLAVYFFTQQHRYNPLYYVLIQLCAFACWDWGMLVFPALVVMTIFYQTSTSRKERLIAILPLGVCWITVLVLKKVFGFSMGYAINSPLVFLKNFFSAPFVTLLPEFSKEFYQSSIGIGAALLLLTALLIYSLRNPVARVALALFFVCQLPQAALGHPQSRYAYVAIFPLCFAVILVGKDLFTQFKMKRGAVLTILCLGALYSIWTHDRVTLWKEGFIQMHALRSEIGALAEGKEEIIVLNLPDRFGPENKIWLPQGWRNGRILFPPSITFYNTPDSPSGLKIIGISDLSLENTKSLLLKNNVYEVKIINDDGKLIYRMCDFTCK